MSRSPNPVFLERAGYRQRRLRDAARLIPFVGIVLWTIPLLWPRDVPQAPSSGDAVIYIFGVWVFLIAVTAIVSRYLRLDDPATDAGDDG